MLDRLVLGLLSSAPPAAVDRARRVPLVAPLLKGIVTAVSLSLVGREIVLAAGEAAGLRFAVDRSSVVWATGRVELPVQQAVAAALFDGAVFFDVGANVGFYTLLAARAVGPTGRVVAFEPHPQNVQALERNVQLNGLENVLIVPKAASRAAGHASLEVRNRATARLGTQHGLEVETVALDDIVSAHPELRPDVVKIDVEGHELDVLAGFRRTLEQAAPILLCEMHGHSAEFVTATSRLGYTCLPVDGTTAASAAHLLARKT